eukprot:scaffold15824_cov155-Skeletonema_menzelii.AAC.6
MASSSSSSPNLLTLIIDITPSTWGQRNIIRSAKDKALAAKNKSSAGPATLDDVLTAILAVGVSFSCLNRDNALVVIAATEYEAAVIYPRKGGEGSMESVVMGGSSGACGERVDAGLMNDYVRLGVAELINRAAERSEKLNAEEGNKEKSQATVSNKGAVIASALSIALCTINRFMVAHHAGVSALADTSYSSQRKDDEGILALMGGKSSSSKQQQQQSQQEERGMISSRALIIQASQDRTSDYNALMNCAFAANKSDIVIDGCFIPSGWKDPSDGKEDPKTSPFLEQIVDQTKGVYLSVPSGAAQVGGALSEVLMSVFLPPPNIRTNMNLPKLNNVDFRARCFETGESIDVAQICNQCLSIFKVKPKDKCLTCGAKVKKRSSSKGGSKRLKVS